MSKLFDFPNDTVEERQLHKCDSCASTAIHDISQQFEEFEPDYMIDKCLRRIFEAEYTEEVIDAVLDLYEEAYEAGEKEILKEEIQMKSEMLAMICADVDGEEQ